MSNHPRNLPRSFNCPIPLRKRLRPKSLPHLKNLSKLLSLNLTRLNQKNLLQSPSFHLVLLHLVSQPHSEQLPQHPNGPLGLVIAAAVQGSVLNPLLRPQTALSQLLEASASNPQPPRLRLRCLASLLALHLLQVKF